MPLNAEGHDPLSPASTSAVGHVDADRVAGERIALQQGFDGRAVGRDALAEAADHVFDDCGQPPVTSMPIVLVNVEPVSVLPWPLPVPPIVALPPASRMPVVSLVKVLPSSIVAVPP